MQLWQLDIMSGVFLANGRECKLVTGLDDHSRYLVLARVVEVPSGRALSAAFTERMATYGVSSEVLTDNGRQFTGRYTKPVPAEARFERICGENSITHRLTRTRSPTTTGKIERLHETLRRELLDHTAPFVDLRSIHTPADRNADGFSTALMIDRDPASDVSSMIINYTGERTDHRTSAGGDGAVRFAPSLWVCWLCQRRAGRVGA